MTRGLDVGALENRSRRWDATSEERSGVSTKQECSETSALFALAAAQTRTAEALESIDETLRRLADLVSELR